MLGARAIDDRGNGRMRLDEFDPSANTRDLGSGGGGGFGLGGGGGGGAGLFGLLFNFLPLLLGRRLSRLVLARERRMLGPDSRGPADAG